MIYQNETFVYNSKTGKLFRKTKNKTKFCSSLLNKGNSGSLMAGMGGRRYSQPRIIWKLVYGYLPDIVDHINGDQRDNRLCNLREVTHLENRRNEKIPKNNTSGCLGVCWRSDIKKWQASISILNRTIYLGIYDNLLDAAAARMRANVKYGFHPNHGAR